MRIARARGAAPGSRSARLCSSSALLRFHETHREHGMCESGFTAPCRCVDAQRVGCPRWIQGREGADPGSEARSASDAMEFLCFGIGQYRIKNSLIAEQVQLENETPRTRTRTCAQGITTSYLDGDQANRSGGPWSLTHPTGQVCVCPCPLPAPWFHPGPVPAPWPAPCTLLPPHPLPAPWPCPVPFPAPWLHPACSVPLASPHLLPAPCLHPSPLPAPWPRPRPLWIAVRCYERSVAPFIRVF